MKYDVSFGEKDVRIQPHHCREWEGDKGCYGTNPNHGFTFDRAKEEVAKWHEAQAEYWRSMTEDDWKTYGY